MQKFVILCHARCGSNLLVDGIRQRPDVRMHAEVFQPRAQERHLHVVSGRPYVDGSDAGAYLDELFADMPSGEAVSSEAVSASAPVDRAPSSTSVARPLAVGLKLFYGHARGVPSALRAWEWLDAHRELRIIHLRRRNLLAALVSLRTAQQTKEWFRPLDVPTGEGPPPLELSAEDCLRYFDTIEAQRREAELRFSGHRVLELEYEADLCVAYSETLHRIWRFLDLPPFESECRLAKQSSGDLRSRLLHYDQMERHFAGTPYAAYFERNTPER